MPTALHLGIGSAAVPCQRTPSAPTLTEPRYSVAFFRSVPRQCVRIEWVIGASRHAVRAGMSILEVGTRPHRTIVAEARFILTPRDTGYRGTVASVPELIDNAIQAN